MQTPNAVQRARALYLNDPMIHARTEARAAQLRRPLEELALTVSRELALFGQCTLFTGNASDNIAILPPESVTFSQDEVVPIRIQEIQIMDRGRVNRNGDFFPAPVIFSEVKRPTRYDIACGRRPMVSHDSSKVAIPGSNPGARTTPPEESATSPSPRERRTAYRAFYNQPEDPPEEFSPPEAGGPVFSREEVEEAIDRGLAQGQREFNEMLDASMQAPSRIAAAPGAQEILEAFETIAISPRERAVTAPTWSTTGAVGITGNTGGGVIEEVPPPWSRNRPRMPWDGKRRNR